MVTHTYVDTDNPVNKSYYLSSDRKRQKRTKIVNNLVVLTHVHDYVSSYLPCIYNSCALDHSSTDKISEEKITS